MITRAAPAFHNLFMVMGCVFDINTVHKTVEKLTFQAFLMVMVMHYRAHFLCGYIEMRFTTPCGGLCQTALSWRSSQSFLCNK